MCKGCIVRRQKLLRQESVTINVNIVIILGKRGDIEGRAEGTFGCWQCPISHMDGSYRGAYLAINH